MKLISFCIVFIFFQTNFNENQPKFDLVKIERERISKLADSYKNELPITITNYTCDRSAGSVHDFYSEGDYWWSNPKDPKGPFIRKDGLSNPDNFTAHREAMIRFSKISGALASAYLITKDEAYVKQLMPHLKAWFVNEATKMNPSLLYAQAISGKVTGRGIGIIDTIHLIEVAKAIEAIENSISVSNNDIIEIKEWFKAYLKWLTTHSFGIKERDNGNNHSTCWAMQVAIFANLVNDEILLDYCRDFYKNTLLPEQMDSKGAFPKELSRTKSYGYSLFNLDAMATLCNVLSSEKENLFLYKTKDGRSLALGFDFLYPFIVNKNSWPLKKDVMYWDDWPVRSAALLFGGVALQNTNYLETWSTLPHDFTKTEIVRNVPVRFPLLWIH